MRVTSDKNKNVPAMPKGATGSKSELGSYLQTCIRYNVASVADTKLVDRQLQVCMEGIHEVKRLMDDVRGDETAQQYRQIYDEHVEDVRQLLSDHLGMFFVACQIYVTRLVESIRWLRFHESGACNMPSFYKDASSVRNNGETIVEDMTVAECMFRLGNYFKHQDEVEGLQPQTTEAMNKLGMRTDDGMTVRDPECAALGKIAGKSIASLADVELAVRRVSALLKGWSTSWVERLVGDVDEYVHGDRTWTKREWDSFKDWNWFEGL